MGDFFRHAALEGRVQVVEGQRARGGGGLVGAVDGAGVGDVQDLVEKAQAAVAQGMAANGIQDLGVGHAEFAPSDVGRNVSVKKHRSQVENKGPFRDRQTPLARVARQFVRGIAAARVVKEPGEAGLEGVGPPAAGEGLGERGDVEGVGVTAGG